MRLLTCATAFALTAALVAAPAAAGAKAPKQPSAATVKKLLAKAYCPPNMSISGAVAESVVVTVTSIKRGKPRLGRYRADGVDPNTKTWVFPTKAVYFCDYTKIDGSYVATDLAVTGEYVFFRNSFREWTFRGTNHNAKRVTP